MSFWDRIFKFRKKKNKTPNLQIVPKPAELPKEGIKTETYYTFGPKSQSRLSTCHPDIQRVMNEAIKYMDFTILEGTRSKATQDRYFNGGTSKVKFPNSYHNTRNADIKEEFRPSGKLTKNVSLAVDAAPWPIDWTDLKRFEDLAVIIKRCAKELDVELDWANDIFETFRDYPHYQLTKYRDR